MRPSLGRIIYHIELITDAVLPGQLKEAAKYPDWAPNKSRTGFDILPISEKDMPATKHQA
jgi:hypothetical protein